MIQISPGELCIYLLQVHQFRSPARRKDNNSIHLMNYMNYFLLMSFLYSISEKSLCENFNGNLHLIFTAIVWETHEI